MTGKTRADPGLNLPKLTYLFDSQRSLSSPGLPGHVWAESPISCEPKGRSTG